MHGHAQTDLSQVVWIDSIKSDPINKIGRLRWDDTDLALVGSRYSDKRIMNLKEIPVQVGD